MSSVEMFCLDFQSSHPSYWAKLMFIQHRATYTLISGLANFAAFFCAMTQRLNLITVATPVECELYKIITHKEKGTTPRETPDRSYMYLVFS